MILRRWSVDSFARVGGGRWTEERRFWTLRDARKWAGLAVTSWRAVTAWRIRDRRTDRTACVVERTSDVTFQVGEDLGWPKARETR